MSDKILKIFELGEKLAKLLEDKEAIADVTSLYQKHPEMFKNLQEVVDTIKKVTIEPDLIAKNPKALNEKDFIAAKRLNNEKMGDVGIRNNNGTNVIFHANKKKISEFKKIEKYEQVSVETPSVNNTAPTRSDHCASKSNEINDLPKCDKAHSTPVQDIIPQNPEKNTTNPQNNKNLKHKNNSKNNKNTQNKGFSR